jgi:hypothetical protein
MAFAPMIAMAVSAAMSIVQGVSSYQANKENARDEKKMGKQAIAAGAANAARQRQILAAQLSQSDAETGASNTLKTGSPMEVYEANLKQGVIIAEDENLEAQLAALGRAKQARIYKQQATSELIGGVGKAASTLGSFKRT